MLAVLLILFLLFIVAFKIFDVKNILRSFNFKATLTLQRTQKFQRAVIFGLLNPQPDQSGFAGIRFNDGPYDLSDYNSFELKFRAQSYKVKFWEMILIGNKYTESYQYLQFYYQKFEVKVKMSKIEVLIHRKFQL